MKNAKETETKIAEEIIWAVMDLLTTLEVLPVEKKYLDFLERIFPLPGLHKEFILKYLEGKKTKITPWMRAKAIEIIHRQIASFLPDQTRQTLLERFGLPRGKQCDINELAKRSGENREKIRKRVIRALREAQKLPIFKILSKSLQTIWEENLRQLLVEPPNES